jgi:hypothetical protein
MSRLILSLFCSCIFGISAFAQANSPRELSDAEAAQIDARINKIKNLPAHRLDRRLPKVSFAEWLYAQAGPDTRVNWDLNYDPAAEDPGWNKPPHMVDAVIVLDDRQSVVVEVAIAHCNRQIVGCRRHVPSVFRIDVITGKNPITGKFESAQLDRLSDLPPFLAKLKQTNSEAQR